MSDLVTLQIDGTEVTVPKGTLVVDAAKRVGNSVTLLIPAFMSSPELAVLRLHLSATARGSFMVFRSLRIDREWKTDKGPEASTPND